MICFLGGTNSSLSRKRVARKDDGVRWLVLILLFATAHNQMAQDKSPAPRRDINAVLADHDQKLIALKGVTGVYVGLLEDGRTPCLRVMLVRDTPELRKAIPASIEGYRVVVEISGEIRPLGSTPRGRKTN